MNFVGNWMELENIIPSEVTQPQMAESLQPIFADINR